jgi:hypothetical protein
LAQHPLPAFACIYREPVPGTALVLSITALVLLAVAPFGWRLGWWPYSFGLYWLMPASGYVGAVAVTLSVLTLALGWSELRPRGLGVLSVALCLSAALVYVPWHYSRVRSTLPPIHDISTDTDNPPAFSAVLPARAAEHAGGVNYDDPQVAQLQKLAYPDLANPLLREDIIARLALGDATNPLTDGLAQYA